MNIKQDYETEEGERVINFTYVGTPRGIIWNGGGIVTFRDGQQRVSMAIEELMDLIPYFKKWNEALS